PAGETFNVGSGIEYSIYEIAQKINRLTGKNLELYYDNKILSGKITKIAANNKKLLNAILWSPKISIDDGLKELVELI
ncbi:MAG TPA: NAD-dependent dehydratase, partial [bacterium]|nr:NAD-dependent dehydratase [bacterium]